MHVHRAVASCPACSEDAEVWYYHGKIEPISVVECNKCSNIYDAKDFITRLLDLYKNETVSAIPSNWI
jgi:Zn ribbon nucleic-acid-binding protein